MLPQDCPEYFNRLNPESQHKLEEEVAYSWARVIQEDLGIQALTVHGRTRACAYRAPAEYQTIAAIKRAVRIPVIASGGAGNADHFVQALTDEGYDVGSADGAVSAEACCWVSA